jgi:hypothetical protein
LPQTVAAGANKIQILNIHVHVWTEKAGIGVSQCAAENMGIWQQKEGLTTQQIDNKVREWVWVIAQFMSIITRQGASPKQWDLLNDGCGTCISYLESKRPLWEQCMADKSNPDGQKLEAAVDKFPKVGLSR